MLKTKSKFIAIFVAIILCFMTSFVSAEDEVMPISVDTENTASDQNDLAETTTENTNEEQPVDETSSEEMATEEETQNTSMKSEDVYLTGDSITIDYVVDGNVFVMAKSVTITSQIAGDVFVCSDNVSIDQTSYISGNLFVVSNNLEINGIVYDVYSVSKNITINNGYVYRDLKSVSENFNFYGTVGRNAFVSSSSLSFVNEETSANGLIYGDLNYSSPSEISIPEGSVSGNIKYSSLNYSNSNIANYFISLGCFLILVIVLWLVRLFIKNRAKQPSNINGKNKALWIVISGILGIILIPLVIIALMFIPITFTISLFFASIFFLLLAISKSVFVIGLNNYICKKLNINKEIGIFGVLIITAIVIWALCLIPYNVGFIISLITMVLGFGILLTSVFNKKIDENSDSTNKVKNIDKTNNKKDSKNTKETKKSNDNNKTDNTKKE